MSAALAPNQPQSTQPPSRVRELLARIRELERELEIELEHRQDRVLEELRSRRRELESGVRDARDRARLSLSRWLQTSRPQNVLTLPFIYGMAIPLVFLDLCLSVYQQLCFRIYDIPRVRRREHFVIDRHLLEYLNVIEKAHCVYCGYANGVLAFGGEIAARTEQFWCPIKHAHRAHSTHSRAEHFLAYGDDRDLRARQAEFRNDLANEFFEYTGHLDSEKETLS